MKNLISLLSRKLTIQVNNDCFASLAAIMLLDQHVGADDELLTTMDEIRQRARRRSYPRSDPSTPGQRPDASRKRCLP